MGAQNLPGPSDLKTFRNRLAGLAARDGFWHKARKIIGRDILTTALFRQLELPLCCSCRCVVAAAVTGGRKRLRSYMRSASGDGGSYNVRRR